MYISTILPGFIKTNVDINACSNDGNKYNKKDKMIQNGMDIDRCIELMLIAISNKLHETWITNRPILELMYLVYYIPGIFFKYIRPFMDKRMKNAVKN